MWLTVDPISWTSVFLLIQGEHTLYEGPDLVPQCDRVLVRGQHFTRIASLGCYPFCLVVGCLLDGLLPQQVDNSLGDDGGSLHAAQLLVDQVLVVGKRVLLLDVNLQGGRVTQVLHTFNFSSAFNAMDSKLC